MFSFMRRKQVVLYSSQQAPFKTHFNTLDVWAQDTYPPEWFREVSSLLFSCCDNAANKEQVLITTCNGAGWLCSFPFENFSSWQMPPSFMSCPEYAPVSCSAFGLSANYGTCLIARLASILFGPVTPRPLERRPHFPSPCLSSLFLLHTNENERRVIVRLCSCLRSHHLAPEFPELQSWTCYPSGKFELGGGSYSGWLLTKSRFNFISTRATLKNSRRIKLFKMSNNYSNAKNGRGKKFKPSTLHTPPLESGISPGIGST